MTRVAVQALAAAIAAAGCSSGGDKAPPAEWKAGSCSTTQPASTGPGDASNHLPLSAGNWWTYRVREQNADLPPAEWHARVRVSGSRVISGVNATVVTVTNPDEASVPAYESLLIKGPAAVVRIPDAASGRLAAVIGPFEILEFPLQAGRSFVQTHCGDLDLGIDVDRDGRRDRVDVHAEVTVVGEEAVSLGAGTFLATRVDTRLWTVVQASSAGAFASESLQQDWYAPGVGAVRSRIEEPSSGYLREESLIGYEVDGTSGGLLGLATLATDLAAADSNTEMPGRPAIAFDGSGHLLVTVRSTGQYAQDRLLAYPVAADGTAGAPVVAGPAGGGFRPAASFNGTNHLVVTSWCDASSSCAHLMGQRVTPSGVPLDGASGFEIPGAGSTVYPPAVASDGDAWLAVHTEFAVEGLRATRIGADGAVSGSVALGLPWSSRAASPAIAWGRGQYLVAWAEDAISVRAVRLAPDGAVLDPEPIVVSSEPSPKVLGGVAWDGTRFLVTWLDARRGDRNGPGYLAHDVYAARVDPDGTVLDPAGIEVNALSGVSKMGASVTAVTGGFAVAWWSDAMDGAGSGIHAARVTGEGLLLDGPPAEPGFEVVRRGAGGSWPVHPTLAPAGTGRTVVVWAENAQVTGQGKAVREAVLAW